MKSKNVIVENTLIIGMDNREVIVSSSAWFEWLRDAAVFYYQSGKTSFTARKQPRRGAMYWYAYARQLGVLRCLYLGRSEGLTAERLNNVAQRFRIESEPSSLITAAVMGDHSRAVRENTVLLEQLYAENGAINLLAVKEQLGTLQLLVQQNRRLTGQSVCYALDLISTMLDALQVTSENAVHDRGNLLQEVQRLRAALPLPDSSSSSIRVRGEVF